MIIFSQKKKEERRKCIIKVKCNDNKILLVTSFFLCHTHVAFNYTLSYRRSMKLVDDAMDLFFPSFE